MIKAPMPPDARDYYTRAIEFSYDISYGGHVAWLEEDVSHVERKLTLLCHLPDGYAARFEQDIERLKSWGVSVHSRPRIGQWENVIGESIYKLHDTPMVRELLRKMDFSQQRDLTNRLSALQQEARNAGYEIAYHDQHTGELRVLAQNEGLRATK